MGEDSSFGIKKIVDCKIDEEGRQMYQVQWLPTWEPAENLATCHNLIDEFWGFVNKAKSLESKAMQKRTQVVQQCKHSIDIDKFGKLSDDNKAEVHKLIERSSGTSVGHLVSPSTLLSTPKFSSKSSSDTWQNNPAVPRKPHTNTSSQQHTSEFPTSKDIKRNPRTVQVIQPASNILKIFLTLM